MNVQIWVQVICYEYIIVLYSLCYSLVNLGCSPWKTIPDVWKKKLWKTWRKFFTLEINYFRHVSFMYFWLNKPNISLPLTFTHIFILRNDKTSCTSNSNYNIKSLLHKPAYIYPWTMMDIMEIINGCKLVDQVCGEECSLTLVLVS